MKDYDNGVVRGRKGRGKVITLTPDQTQCSGVVTADQSTVASTQHPRGWISGKGMWKKMSKGRAKEWKNLYCASTNSNERMSFN